MGDRVSVDVTPVFAEYFAGNRGPVPNDPGSRQPPHYGIAANLDDRVVNLALTFLSAEAYCCGEWGCHLKLHPGKRWDWLQRELSNRGLEIPSQLELHLAVAIQPGALFFDWSRPDPVRRGWYSFAPAKQQEYQVAVVELRVVGSVTATCRLLR